jgi:hypothetical protein
MNFERTLIDQSTYHVTLNVFLQAQIGRKESPDTTKTWITSSSRASRRRWRRRSRRSNSSGQLRLRRQLGRRRGRSADSSKVGRSSSPKSDRQDVGRGFQVKVLRRFTRSLKHAKCCNDKQKYNWTKMKVSEYLLKAWMHQSMTCNFVCEQVWRVFKTVIWKKEHFLSADKIS